MKKKQQKQKTVSGSSVSPESAIPAGSGLAKKDLRREKYHDKMLKLGFKKIHPYVHLDDVASVLDMVEEMRRKRLE